MNVVNLYGGLGNQLFQYFFGKYVLSAGASYNEDFLKTYSLHNSRLSNVLDFKNEQFTNSKSFYEKQPVFLRKIYGKFGISVLLPGFYDDKKFSLKNRTITNKYFQGYWQKASYFDCFKEQIVKEKWKRDVVMTTIPKSYTNLLKSYNCLTIHMRKSDYLKGKNIGVYHNMDRNFYERLLSQKRFQKYKTLFVLSDDLKWVKENIGKEFVKKKVVLCDEKQKTSLSQDFFMMSIASNLLISNSTFSWWSAFINRSGKIFIPKAWNKKGPNELISAGWLVV